MAILILCFFSYGNAYSTAKLVVAYNSDLLIVITTAMCLQVLSGLIGFTGSLLHKKEVLTLFNLTIWIIMAFLIAISFAAYKQAHLTNFNSDLSAKWTALSVSNRAMIQDQASECF